MAVRKVLLIGGSGFVGGWVASRLSAAGVRVTIPTRRRENRKRLLLLPTVFEVQADVGDPQTLAALVEGVDAVINLVGILHSRDVALPYSRDFAEAQSNCRRKSSPPARRPATPWAAWSRWSRTACPPGSARTARATGGWTPSWPVR